jgi:tetratricopeptide (TPR) repeat protein
MNRESASSQAGFAWLKAAAQRLRAGEAAALLAETLEALAQDANNAQLLQIASMACTYDGHGDQAEPYARRALAVIEKDHHAAPRLIEAAHLGLYDSLIAQAKYLEAARSLEAAVRKAPHTNTLLLLMAWAHFLAGHPQDVRSALSRRVPNDPSTTGSDEIAASLPSFHYLIGPFMEHALEIYPKPLQTHPLQKQLFGLLKRAMPREMNENRMRVITSSLANLEDEARRLAQTPYGQRLSQILKTMRSLEWLAEYDSRIIWG